MLEISDQEIRRSMREEENGEQWGAYCLTKRSEQSIRQFGEELDEINSELGRLLKQLRTRNCAIEVEKDFSRPSLEELHDFHYQKFIHDEKPVSDEPGLERTSYCTRSKQEICDVSNDLLRVIQRKANVASAMTIVSALNDGDLRVVIKNVWQKLLNDADRILFISHLSSSFESSKALCDEVILLMFQDEKMAKPFFELVQPQITYLDSCVVSGVVLPLIKDSETIFAKDLGFFGEFFTSLSDSQKLTTIRLFCSRIEELQHWQLPILEKIVKNVTLTPDTASLCSEFLATNMSSFSRDRSMGSILLHFLTQLTKPSLKDVLNSARPLFSRYNGIFKVRLREELEKLT